MHGLIPQAPALRTVLRQTATWVTARNVRAELHEAAANIEALEGLRGLWPLLVKEGRAVFSARLKGQPVVVKLIRDPDRSQTDTTAAWEELRTAHTHMAQGPYQVPRPLVAVPERGLLVMARAPGQRLTDVLRRMSPDRGAALTRHAADWLAAFTETRRRTGAFASEFWIGQRQARTDDMPDPELRRVARHLIVSLKMQGARLHHVPVTQVRPHGDFWSHNMIWDGAVMTGIDLQSTTWQPLARDPARFVVHQSLILPATDGPWRHGLPAHWTRAFESAPLLRAEPTGLFRFFIGIELHHRLLAEARFPKTRAETRAALDRYLSTPDDQP